MGELNYQAGTVVEGCDHAVFIEANFKLMNKENVDAIKEALGDFSARLRSYQTRFSNMGLSAVVAFGRNAWTELSGNEHSAPELHDLATMANGMMQADQRDMFVHILSHEQKINFSLAQEFVALFQGLVEIKEEVHGFRWIEARDLSGFVDGTENPKGLDDRVGVAIIGEGEDAGGSYVLAQRWEHSLEQFNHFDVKAQEKVFGRTKQDDIEMSDEEKPMGAHTERVVIEDDGEELAIVRQSLPYGYASGTKGLYFVSYCAKLSSIDAMLKRMGGETDEHFDRMFSYTKAVTGSYLYAPSLDQLDALDDA